MKHKETHEETHKETHGDTKKYIKGRKERHK